MSERLPSDTQSMDDDASAAAVAGNFPQISGYEIIRELNRGGQGVVYQAVQISTKRKVALKVLIEGTLASPAAQRRFLREIELAASLRHRSIVTVFDSGTTPEGRQFYVMDYIRGQSITDYARQSGLSPQRVLELFRTVCDAVAYAHQRGVIHRDLKPSNILVDAEGIARVLDFGLAKTIADRADPMASMSGQIVGTLRYMSPEQTRGNPDEIDMRTDVYSLGVVLYELLTGGFPYPVEGSLVEVLRHIVSTEPAAAARTWSAQAGAHRGGRRCPIDDELSTILRKCLSKDRERRYQNAGELSRDLGHYLADEPLEAKRDSAIYVLRKTLARHRGPVAAAMVILAISAIGLAVSAVAWHRAAVERDAAIRAGDTARAAEQLADEQNQLAQLTVARSYARQHEFALARNILESVNPSGSLAQDWRWAAWEYLRRSGEISSVDLNADMPPGARLRPANDTHSTAWIDVPGQRIWVFGGGLPRVFDLESGRNIPIPPGQQVQKPPTWFSRDPVHLEGNKGGRHIVVDAKGWPERTENTIALLKPDGTAAWKQNVPLPGIAGVGSLSDDGSQLALAMENDTIQIRRIGDDGSEILRTIDGVHDNVAALAFDSSGQRLHVVTGGWMHRIYSVKSDADVEQTLAAHQSTVRRIAFDATGRLLASGSYDGRLKVWDVRTHQLLADMMVMKKNGVMINGVTETRFLPDGRIVTADADGVVQIWDWHSGSSIKCHTGSGTWGAVAMSDDGRTLYAAGTRNIARWNMQTAEQDGVPFGDDGASGYESNYRLIWLHDKNRLIALRSQDYRDAPSLEKIRCQVWDLAGPTLLRELQFHTDGLRDADVSADENLLAISSRDGRATLWDWQSGKLLHVLNASPGHADTNIISAIKFDPTQPVVATAGEDNRVLFWSTQTGRQLAELDVDEQRQRGFGPAGLLKDIAFSPDGKLLAVTVGNDIWWVDLGFFDQQINDLARRP
jgi:WD40 repeat protein